MSRATRVVPRIHDEQVAIERCDGCGTEVELEESNNSFRQTPASWFRLFTPEDRVQAFAGFESGRSFCSASCLLSFAGTLVPFAGTLMPW